MPSSTNARLVYRAAKQRFEDAEFLLSVGRTTAAVYLAGYSVECILKAMILVSVPRGDEAGILAMFRGARAHDYGWLFQLYVERGGRRFPAQLVPHFARVNSWSTDMRYSPGTVKLRDASAFLDSVLEILNWGDGRIS
jgi:hypothetical protein